MLIASLVFAVALLDQITKHLVWQTFGLGDAIPVIPGLMNLVYVRNTGAAFGMLTGMNVVLVSLSVIMLAVLILFRRQLVGDRPVHHVAVGLMLAGIVGNLVDRVRLGYVIDFLDFYWRSYPKHFPAFNVADSAICIGVGLYIVSQFFERGEARDG